MLQTAATGLFIAQTVSLGSVENLDQGQEPEGTRCYARDQRYVLDKFSRLTARIYCFWHRPKSFEVVAFSRATVRLKAGVMLALKKTGKHFYQQWCADIYVVLDADRVIGLELLHLTNPISRP